MFVNFQHGHSMALGTLHNLDSFLKLSQLPQEKTPVKASHIYIRKTSN